MFLINEIFYSLQGEGFWTGTPMLFIRFAGCNLKCHFCDTDFLTGDRMTIEDIIKECAKYPVTKICLTGGEPMLQVTPELLNALAEVGYSLHIETNGTFLISNEINNWLDWITVSPKQNQPWLQRYGNELKVVYEGQDLAQYIPNSESFTNFDNYYLQPMSQKNTLEVVKQCLKNPLWKLSLQTQKHIGLK